MTPSTSIYPSIIPYVKPGIFIIASCNKLCMPKQMNIIMDRNKSSLLEDDKDNVDFGVVRVECCFVSTLGLSISLVFILLMVSVLVRLSSEILCAVDTVIMITCLYYD